MKGLQQAAFALAAATVVMTSANAQSARVARNSADAGVMEEVLAFRDKVRAAVAAKDRAALDSLYADGFMHLRDSGRVDLKADRITLLLSGEPTIETAPDESVDVRAFGPMTAVAT